MGFFSKLFGGGNDGGSSDTGFGSSGIGMLRTVNSGGYDKASVLGALDTLNTEIMALTEARSAKDAGRPYTLPAHTEPQLRSVSKGGFNEEDVERYMAELQQKIEELRAQL